MNTSDFDKSINIALENGWIAETKDEQWGTQYNIEILLSCPFCDGQPRHVDIQEYARVECLKCGAKSKAIQREHGKDEIYNIIPIILWNSSANNKRIQYKADCITNKQEGLQEKEYWNLLDKRLRKEGIRL